MQEVWLPVVGYEGLYEVSDQGRVRSVERRYTTRNKWNSFERIKRSYVLKPKVDRYGYLEVRLSKGSRSEFGCYTVHRLVARAFLGPCPDGQQVRHGILGKQDNSPGNLCYGTASENAKDKIRDGTSLRGIRNHTNALTEDQVWAIYRAEGGRGLATRLADDYGVTVSCIHHIRKGRSWTWLTQV